jgi:hypothetical protein
MSSPPGLRPASARSSLATSFGVVSPAPLDGEGGRDRAGALAEAGRLRRSERRSHRRRHACRSARSGSCSIAGADPVRTTCARLTVSLQIHPASVIASRMSRASRRDCARVLDGRVLARKPRDRAVDLGPLVSGLHVDRLLAPLAIHPDERPSRRNSRHERRRLRWVARQDAGGRRLQRLRQPKSSTLTMPSATSDRLAAERGGGLPRLGHPQSSAGRDAAGS